MIAAFLFTAAFGYQTGDLVFIKSQTQQSQAIREATNSEWSHVGMFIDPKTVASEKGGLVKESLKSFISKSKDQEYKVFRYKKYDQKMNKDLLKSLSYYDRPYDIYFEWSDTKQYCSEFTYKVMEKLTGRGVGSVQKFKDMNLESPAVQALIKKRYEDTGKPFNMEEPIVTPVSQMIDPEVVEVKE